MSIEGRSPFRRLRAALLLLGPACAGPGVRPVPPAPAAPAPVEAHLARARALASEGFARAAIETVDAALLREPDRNEALRLKARLHESLGEERAAIAVYDRLSARAPGDLDALYHSARARLRIGDVEEALVGLRRFAAIAPGDAEGRRALGTALYRKAIAGAPANARFLAEAEEELRAARDLRPEAADLHHDLASLRVVRGDLAGAEEEYRRALERDPEHLSALEGLAELLDGQDRRTEARELAGRALRLERHPLRRRTLEQILGEGEG
ncbi:MAG: tetratricopeptide repeat protein [Planctomycetes bacterium]|nr:tetratricopeptide repeat protein [Planctomycetota bacterium]